ncbi:MAG TPA: HAD hydrolase-like protein [Elusimicrobiota bacterium]|nr:HAD hydrolase-like protein [Elusimicrobiota bacterium]
MKLLLFDVDGTLVHTGGAGLKALNKAFHQLYDLDDAMNGVAAAGKTDKIIVREVFEKKLNRPGTPTDISAVLELYLIHLDDEMRHGTYTVLEGVVDLLELLSRHPERFLLGLGTGNLDKGARIKLEPAGLNRYFAFGGFGSDAENRAELLRAGIRRAESLRGHPFPLSDIYIIGDTILDVQAGKAVGAVTVAVAAGSGRKDDLVASRADLLIDSFADPGPLLSHLGIAPLVRT